MGLEQDGGCSSWVVGRLDGGGELAYERAAN